MSVTALGAQLKVISSRERAWERDSPQIESYLETIAASASPRLLVDDSLPGGLLDDSGDVLWHASRIAEYGPPWTVWEGGIAYPIGGSTDDREPWGWGVVVADKDRRRMGVEWVR